jgi:hypothetical protein
MPNKAGGLHADAVVQHTGADGVFECAGGIHFHRQPHVVNARANHGGHILRRQPATHLELDLAAVCAARALALKKRLEHHVRSGSGHAGEFDVFHDSDDFDLYPAQKEEAPAERILVPEQAARGALGQNRHFGRAFVVETREASPRDQRDMQSVEVGPVHLQYIRGVHGFRRLGQGDRIADPTVAERQEIRSPHRLDLRRALERPRQSENLARWGIAVFRVLRG